MPGRDDMRRRVGRPVRGAAVLLAVAVLLPACSARGTVESTAWEHIRSTARHAPQLQRWPAGTELVVEVAGLNDRDVAAVFRAFDAWLAEARTPVRARRAQPDEAANVIIRGVDEVDAGREAMGVTRLDWEGPWLVAAEVELARSTRCGSFLSSTERRRTLLHEIGHVLGLGHSPRLSSIMHRDAPGASVDDRDRAALELLYDLAPRVAVTATAPDIE
ncbi:MAG: matrixin family metalloprotease [Longimicrobiales bacterium]|nr:matrixin family metalloprotease [Longimicrobiales bacterium]